MGAATTVGTRGTITEKVEPRPGAEARADRQVEHARDAVDDGEAEAEAPLLARRLVLGLQTDEFVEDDDLLVGRYTRPVVPDLDTQLLAAAVPDDTAAPQQHTRRPALDPAVAQRVGQQVLQDAAQEGRVGRHESARRHDDQLDTATRGDRREGGGERLEQRLQRERALLGLEGAGVELGDVEERIEQRFDGAQARIDLAAQVIAGIAVDHRRRETGARHAAAAADRDWRRQ